MVAAENLNLVEVAALVGDTARATMLSALIGGRSLTAWRTYKKGPFAMGLCSLMLRLTTSSGKGNSRPQAGVVTFKSGMGIAVRSGANIAPIKSAKELKQALINAKSVAISARGAGGAITRQVFERLEIAEIMATKTLVPSSGVSAEAVVDGPKNRMRRHGASHSALMPNL